MLPYGIIFNNSTPIVSQGLSFNIKPSISDDFDFTQDNLISLTICLQVINYSMVIFQKNFNTSIVQYSLYHFTENRLVKG